jgi:hypothetical protein
MLTALYVAANEGSVIADSIRSVTEYADRIVVVDALFHGNPQEGTHSSDNQREVVESMVGDRELIYLESDQRLPEHAARNLALAQVPMGEYGLIIDADEVLYGDHPRVASVLGDPLQHLNLWVYTSTIRFNQPALEMDPDTYARGRVLNTRGSAPRVVRQMPGLQARSIVHPSGFTTHSDLYVGESPLRGFQEEQPFLINHRLRRSLPAYKNAYAWEVAQGGRPTNVFQRGEM